jgi:hypothetical protein
MINDIEVIESHSPTNIVEIKRFEELIQAKLPEDYKQFLLKNNGGHPIRKAFKLIEPINEKNKEASIAWFYALYNGEVCNITTEFRTSREQIPDELLPIAYGHGGEICLGVNGEYYGKLYYWTTNYSFWTVDDYNYLYLIANSFTDFINGLFEREVDDNGKFVIRYPDGTVTITAE